MAKGYKYLITVVGYFLLRVVINLLFNDPVTGKHALALAAEAVLWSATYYGIMHLVQNRNSKHSKN